MKLNKFPTISRLCPEDWKAMHGDDKRRFCDHCQLHVHNLSAMSAAERQALLAERATRKCVAYLAADASLHVQSRAWIVLQRLMRPWRAALALLAVLLPYGFSGCASTRPEPPRPVDVHDCKQVKSPSDGEVWKGMIAPEPPLWRRVLFFWE